MNSPLDDEYEARQRDLRALAGIVFSYPEGVPFSVADKVAAQAIADRLGIGQPPGEVAAWQKHLLDLAELEADAIATLPEVVGIPEAETPVRQLIARTRLHRAAAVRLPLDDER